MTNDNNDRHIFNPHIMIKKIMTHMTDTLKKHMIIMTVMRKITDTHKSNIL